MKKSLLYLCLLVLPFQLLSQEEPAESAPETFTIVLSQDNAFGFNPSLYGSFGIGKDGSWDGISFTYYNIFWTNPSYGTLIDGSDLWLETGVGIGLSALSGKVYVNPSIGLTHGKLLSDSPRGSFAEGIVPSISATFNDGRLEGEVFFAYYKALKNNGSNSGDYLLYWILPGVRVSKRVSLGMHYERFDRIRHGRGETNTPGWAGISNLTSATVIFFAFLPGLTLRIMAFTVIIFTSWRPRLCCREGVVTGYWLFVSGYWEGLFVVR